MTDVTRILSQIESGDPSAAEQLLPLVYDELRMLAAAKLANETSGQTLQATALVYDAYIRLVDVEKAQNWNRRGHFFGAAAEAIRRILVENARRKQELKHGGLTLANKIEIVDNGQGVDVRGVGTTINYPLNYLKSFPQVLGDLIIKMNGGADTVVVSDVGNGSATEFLGSQYEVLGRIVIEGGGGRDNILVNSPNDRLPEIRGLSIFGGSAADCVKVIGVDIDNTAATNDLLVRLAGGNDTLVIDSDESDIVDSRVHGKTLIDAGVGDDQIRISAAIANQIDGAEGYQT